MEILHIKNNYKFEASIGINKAYAQAFKSRLLIIFPQKKSKQNYAIRLPYLFRFDLLSIERTRKSSSIEYTWQLAHRIPIN